MNRYVPQIQRRPQPQEIPESRKIAAALAAFGDRIVAYAHTPAGQLAADHALDWAFNGFDESMPVQKKRVA